MKSIFRKGLGILLPIIGGLSLIGFGFCVWAFVDPQDNTLTLPNLGVLVTGKASEGTWGTFKAPNEMVFKEGAEVQKDLTHCVEFYTTNSSSEYERYDEIEGSWVASSSSEMTEEVLNKINFSYKINMTYYERDADKKLILDSSGNPIIHLRTDSVLKDYFSFTDPNLHFNTEIEVGNVTRVGNNFSFHVDLSQLFQYKNIDKKPLTLEKFTEMYNALTSQENNLLVEFIAHM